MHFQIFIPTDSDTSIPANEQLRRVGLESLWMDATSIRQEGPDGQMGIRFGWQLPLPDVHTLKWIPAIPRDGLPAGRYLYGYDPAQPPTPNDLKRPVQFDGILAELGDGHTWHIPVPTRLPNALMVNYDGSLRLEPVKRLNGYWMDSKYIALTEDYAAILADVDPADIEDQKRRFRLEAQRDYAFTALNVNYRMAFEMLAEQPLIDEVNVEKYFMVAPYALFLNRKD